MIPINTRDLSFITKRIKDLTEENMSKNCAYSILCSCGEKKGETRCPLKVRLEEHRKAIMRGETR